MPKTALTPAEIAALAASAGITPGAAASAAAEVTESQNENPEPQAAGEVEANPAPAAAAAAAPAAPAAPSAIEVLTNQLAANAQTLAQTQLQLTQANSRVEALEKTVGGLSAVVALSVSNMRVAMGGTAPDLTALSAEQLLAEHTSTSEKFKATFKTGGVAAVTPSADAQPAVATDSRHMARIAATRFNTNAA